MLVAILTNTPSVLKVSFLLILKGRYSGLMAVVRVLLGTSVIMYRSSELRRFQYYVITDWSGGVYASPSMAGSRYVSL